MAKNIHIGKLIQEALESREISVAEFAKQIGITRDGAYKIFKSGTTTSDTLFKVSLALDHDFFAEYSKRLNIKD